MRLKGDQSHPMGTRMKSSSILVLMGCLWPTFASLTRVNHDVCGITMDSGRLNGTCEGLSTLLYRSKVEVLSCASLFNTTFYAPAFVTTESGCKVLLLDYLKCNYGPCKPDIVYGGDILMYILLTIVGLATLLALMTMCFMCRHKIGASEMEWSRTGVLVSTDEYHHDLTWKTLLLLLLCRPMPTSGCLSPVSSSLLNGTVEYTFTPEQGGIICTSNGTITLGASGMRYETTHLYDSAKWEHHTWSANGCGSAGLCGNEGDCAEWGEQGKVVHSERKQYLKTCKPHSRSFFPCFYKWGCWLATREVFWQAKNEVGVYEIGSSAKFDEHRVIGLQACRVEVEAYATSDLMGKSLVVSHANSRLCEKASMPFRPVTSMVGDLQILNGTSYFDYGSFKCEFAEIESSGKCKVAQSALNWNSICVALPILTKAYSLSVIKGSLVEMGVSRRVILTCPESVAVLDHKEECFDKRVELHGIKEESGLTIMTLSAKSVSGKGTWVAHSDCFSDSISVPCDGSSYGHKLYSELDKECLVDQEPVEDRREEMQPPEWVWDQTSHSLPNLDWFGSHHLAALVLLVVLACILLKLLCK